MEKVVVVCDSCGAVCPDGKVKYTAIVRFDPPEFFVLAKYVPAEHRASVKATKHLCGDKCLVQQVLVWCNDAVNSARGNGE